MRKGTIVYGRDGKPIEVYDVKPQVNFFDKDKIQNLRVCAYTRVSTDSEEQETSIKLQKEYFEDMIKKQQNWVLVEIYADEGISGTQLKKRDAFNKMIQDCKDGKIDLIVTKNVSRFARNTVDVLQVAQELRSLPRPVYIFFEQENLNTEDWYKSEMMLTMHAVMAQNESSNKSQSQRWSFERRIKRGDFLTPPPFGYYKNEVTKEQKEKKEPQPLLVDDSEARFVRLCYALLAQGKTFDEIADMLQGTTIRRKNGKIKKWSRSGILSMIKNERYCGDILAGKTYTQDYKTHKKVKNKVINGKSERLQVYRADHHDPIVSREIYEYVMKLIEARKHHVRKVPLALSVIPHGALKGFVPINRGLNGFTMADYINASKSVYEGENESDTFQFDVSKVSDDDLSDYQIITSQLFVQNYRPICILTNTSISFNAQCRKRIDTENVELLFHPKEKLFAIRPCTADNINAIKWKSKATIKFFSEALFDYMKWDKNHRYKLYGTRRAKDDEQILFFDLTKPQVTINEENRQITIFHEKLKEKYGNDFYDNLVSCGVYLTDILNLWELKAECDLLPDGQERAEIIDKLCAEYTKEFNIKEQQHGKQRK